MKWGRTVDSWSDITPGTLVVYRPTHMLRVFLYATREGGVLYGARTVGGFGAFMYHFTGEDYSVVEDCSSLEEER